MPIHDWTRVKAGIFHHFHHAWIFAISDALNRGLLPSDYYALAEQIAGGFGPDVLGKAKSVVVRHASDHRVVAMVEIVSPGNKSGRSALDQFVEKAQNLLNRGVHLLIIDLFSPGSFDHGGIHKLIWDYPEDTFVPDPDKPLTLAAYVGGDATEAFVEPTAVGLSLIDMPLFLAAGAYVSVPLEATAQAAWEAVPAVWRQVLEGKC